MLQISVLKALVFLNQDDCTSFMLDGLGEALKKTIAKIRGSTYIDAQLVNDVVRDLQRALLQADVNVKLVFSLSEHIKKRLSDQKPPAGITPKEFLIQILYEELAEFVGGKTEPIDTAKHHPFVFMLVGLFGAGKTTTTGKLAKYYAKRGKRVLVVSTDTWRPAAALQLKTLADRAGVGCFILPEEKSPAVIISESKKLWSKYDIVIIDTAGRDALSDELITELQEIYAGVQPHMSLLVLAADIGQAAERQAKAFAEHTNVRGVIITKMDGTAKGGGALAACAVTDAPVRFMGVGETIDDLEEFKSENFIGRLLGMGDLEALLSKVQDAFKQEDAEDVAKRMMKGNFTLNDLYDQIKAMNKMGPMAKVMEMIPGFSQMQIPKEALKGQQEKMKVYKFIIDSCTVQERQEPDLISGNRIVRIANGSGTDETEVRELLKQHRQARKMLKMFKGAPKDEKSMKKMMQRMSKGRAGY